MMEQQEPYESRDSRTDLWGPKGEIPLGYPAIPLRGKSMGVEEQRRKLCLFEVG